ncbi:MAG: BolA/IbaG family iron-sulfur metabolism protein [Gammaproteobacteria bacterium]|nr:BolA/IbaG family iron-sulfur metabolism protein [Gammaproteobacteria bacterium]
MMQTEITKKLENEFEPSFLKVEDETHMHNVPAGSQSHFKIIVVSERFDGESLINRHRMINKVLEDELKIIHALAVHAYTPEQWIEKSDKELASPLCEGGGK